VSPYTESSRVLPYTESCATVNHNLKWPLLQREQIQDLVSVLKEAKNAAMLVIQENAYKEGSAENDIESQRLMERLYVLDEGLRKILADANKGRGRKRKRATQDSSDKLEEIRATPQKDHEILSGDQYKTDELYLQALGGWAKLNYQHVYL